jgi:DNA-binding response OmpR family regulator/KaiC/GvpD/RAD55 family RecA-like ATPase
VVNQSAFDKIATGIETIDDQMGGLIAGKTYLVYGEPGTGKTVFGLQFLNAGLLLGETCALVTQENPDDLLTMGKHLGFDWDEYFASGQLVVLRYQPNFALHFSKSFDFEDIFGELQHLSGDRPIHRTAFDPITPFVDCANRMNYMKVFAELFDLFKSLGATCILTLDEISGVNSSAFLRTLISLAFGVIHLRISPDLKRKMFFQKMKYQPELLQPSAYSIEPQKGIVCAEAKKEKKEPEPVAPAAPQQPKQTPRKTTGKKRILVADHDLETCEGIKRALGGKYDLTLVHDGVEALTKIVNNPLDLIIADTTLPKIDGFDICRRIRTQGSHVPVFLVSGKKRRISDKIRGFSLQADEYMLKPVNFQELESRVQAILLRGRELTHPPLPADVELSEAIAKLSELSPEEKEACGPLSDGAFKKKVEAEIERAPSSSFTLVSYQFRSTDGADRDKIAQTCTATLLKEARAEDFIGDLGNGKVCIFLRGASREASSAFVKRARKKVLRLARDHERKMSTSLDVNVGSATFPDDGEDTMTLLVKAFGRGSKGA